MSLSTQAIAAKRSLSDDDESIFFASSSLSRSPSNTPNASKRINRSKSVASADKVEVKKYDESNTTEVLKDIKASLDQLVVQNKIFLKELEEVKSDLEVERVKSSKLEARVQALESKLVQLDIKKRRKNLIFSGLSNVGADLKDSAETVRKICVDVLDLSVNDIHISATYSIGKNKQATLVRFQNESEVLTILKRTGKLKGKKIYIDRDYSWEVRRRRSFLLKIRKRILEVSAESKVLVRGDLMVIDNKKFTFNNENIVCDGQDGLMQLNKMFNFKKPLEASEIC